MSANFRPSDIKLEALDLLPILSPVEIGRIDRALLPQMIHDASQDPDPGNMFMRLSLLFHSLGSRGRSNIAAFTDTDARGLPPFA